MATNNHQTNNMRQQPIPEQGETFEISAHFQLKVLDINHSFVVQGCLRVINKQAALELKLRSVYAINFNIMETKVFEEGKMAYTVCCHRADWNEIMEDLHKVAELMQAEA